MAKEWHLLRYYIVRVYYCLFARTTTVRYCSDGETWSTKNVRTTPGLLHRIPLKDDGLASIVEIDINWNIEFVDMPNSEQFWFEDDKLATQGFRRYVCRHIPIGHGYKEVKFKLNLQSNMLR